MIREIDHIGVVVKDARATAETLSAVFGFETKETVKSPAGDFITTIVSCGNARLELIEPVGAEGSMARFLEQRGGGIHHVSFRTDDIVGELDSLKGKGVRVIGEQPAAVESSLVSFVHPSSTAGILVELIERGAGE